MAKKAATKAAKPAEKVAETKGPGLGRKYCPHCSKSIAARSTTCPECGKAIKPKKKKADKGPKRAAVAAQSANNHASAYEVIMLGKQFVEKAGGITNAAEILHAFLTTK